MSHRINYIRLIKGIQISWFGGVVGAPYHKIQIVILAQKREWCIGNKHTKIF